MSLKENILSRLPLSSGISSFFPFRSQNTSRLLPWIISLITYLALLLAAATYFLYTLGFTWQENLSHQFTIEWENKGQAPSSLVTSLTTIKGISSATLLTKKDLEPLFANLKHMDLNLDELSLPVIINVSIPSNSALTETQLSEQITHLGFQDITITDHRAWQGQVKTIVLSVLLGMASLALITVVSVLLFTIFATRTSLRIHQQILEILSLVGAPPTYIAQQFQRHFMKQGFFAALGAVAAFWLTVFAVSSILKGHPAYGAFLSFFTAPAVLGFSLLAFGVTLLMVMTTRITVLRALAHVR